MLPDQNPARTLSPPAASDSHPRGLSGLGRSAVLGPLGTLPGAPPRREPAQGGEGAAQGRSALTRAAGTGGAAGASSPGAVLRGESWARGRRGSPGDLRPRCWGPAPPPAPSGTACGGRSERRGAGGRSAQERARARRLVPARPWPGSVPRRPRPPPPLGSPHGAQRDDSRAGKAPCEVPAKPSARLEIAPRPPGAPPPAWPRPEVAAAAAVARPRGESPLGSAGSSPVPHPRAPCRSRGPAG